MHEGVNTTRACRRKQRGSAVNIDARELGLRAIDRDLGSAVDYPIYSRQRQAPCVCVIEIPSDLSYIKSAVAALHHRDKLTSGGKLKCNCSSE